MHGQGLSGSSQAAPESGWFGHAGQPAVGLLTGMPRMDTCQPSYLFREWLAQTPGGAVTASVWAHPATLGQLVGIAVMHLAITMMIWGGKRDK